MQRLLLSKFWPVGKRQLGFFLSGSRPIGPDTLRAHALKAGEVLVPGTSRRAWRTAIAKVRAGFGYLQSGKAGQENPNERNLHF